MLDKLSRAVGLGSPKRQLHELQAFVAQLEASDPTAVSPLATKVAAYRTLFESKNIRVGDPVAYLTEKPAILARMEDYARDMARSGDQLDRDAVGVWLHTLRAASAMAAKSKDAGEFQRLATDMWAILKRAAPDTPDPAFEPEVFSS